MSLIRPKIRTAQSESSIPGPEAAGKASILSYFRAWELYPIVLIAGLLRLYHLDKSLFTDDQASIYRIAHDALAHGVLPVTSNISSTGIFHAPASVYFYILPAFFSNDPLWANVATGLFNTLGIVLAYIFVRRYFGRLVAFIVTALYATGAAAIEYSRFIWQPNLVPPLIILFMFALFWGVVERRKGWLVPALFFFGILIQLHESNYLLIIPLLLAIVLAPKTIRWRDIALGGFLFLFVCFPYLLWENANHFGDISTLIHSPRNEPPRIDTQVLQFYQFFISPFEQNSVHRTNLLPVDSRSILINTWLHYFRRLLLLVSAAMPWLLIGGIITALVMLVRRGRADALESKAAPERIGAWWTDFMDAPFRRGLALLLTWQIAPLIILLRHTIPLEPHYLLLLVPGQYILIALFLEALIQIVHRYRPDWDRIGHYGVYATTACILAVQLFGSTAVLYDNLEGNFNDGPLYPYFNDLGSLEHALNEADQIAQQRHIHRVYVTTDDSTAVPFHYLIELMHTPALAFDAQHSPCLVLPNPNAGPALFLASPGEGYINTLLNQFAHVALLDQPGRLGRAWRPFNLYLITSRPANESVTPPGFTNGLKPFEAHPQVVTTTLGKTVSSSLQMRWSLLNSAQPSWRTLYNYSFQLHSLDGATHDLNCSLTRTWAGDELLVGYDLLQDGPISSPIDIQAQIMQSVPETIAFGPFTLEPFANSTLPAQTLRTNEGKDSIRLSW